MLKIAREKRRVDPKLIFGDVIGHCPGLPREQYTVRLIFARTSKIQIRRSGVKWGQRPGDPALFKTAARCYRRNPHGNARPPDPGRNPRNSGTNEISSPKARPYTGDSFMPIVFEHKGTPLTQSDIQNAATSLGGDLASLWSLMAVETQGFGFLQDRRPCILFERHVFHQRTGGEYDNDNPNLSNPIPGGYLGGAAEYGRLGEALKLDETAALESTSWGLGQIMGYNAVTAGFAGVHAMVAAMVAGESAQLAAITNFIAADPALNDAFRDRNWTTVALNYNGPDYAENHYDDKLAEYYKIFSSPAALPDIDARTAQVCLYYLNYLPDGVDGLNGPRTKQAVLAFRLRNGLPPGGLDANVMRLLREGAGI
jgi:hypothetical protein